MNANDANMNDVAGIAAYSLAWVEFLEINVRLVSVTWQELTSL